MAIEPFFVLALSRSLINKVEGLCHLGTIDDVVAFKLLRF